MGWARTKAFTSERPSSPSLMKWLLLGALAIIVGVLLFIIHASGEIKLLSELNIWMITLTPPLIWLLLICARGWLWGKKLDHYHFLQNEAKYGQQQWEDWAGRYLAIVTGCILLPEDVSASVLHGEDGRSLPSRGGLVCRIYEQLPHSEEILTICLRAIQHSVQNLQAGLPLRITLLTDLSHNEVAESFPVVWAELFPDIARPTEVVITSSLSMMKVEERLKHPSTTVDLIVVMQLSGGEHYSDGLAVLLLTSDDVAHQYRLSHTARLLRPMPLDRNAVDTEFPLFLDTQTAALGSSRILGDSLMWEEVMASLMSHGAVKGATWQPEMRLLLEQCCGVQGPFAPWILTALASELVTLSQKPLLTLFSSGEEHFISTVTTGSVYEHIG